MSEEKKQDCRCSQEPLILDEEMHKKARMKIYQTYSDLDMWLLYGILKSLPPFYATKGRTDVNFDITVFLLENQLAIAFTTGLLRSTRGEALLYFLEKDLPEPGIKMYPRDVDQLPSASQASHLAIRKSELDQMEKNEETSSSSQDQRQ